MKFNSIDEYITSAPKNAQSILKKIRKEVKSRIPNATETISYSMPAFRGKTGAKKVFFFFAAFKNHIGIYPPLKNKKLKKLLADNMNEKGNLAFPYDQEIPIKLIGDIAVELNKEINKK
jgi:uncharacterized protein YdhG (YjbR/CyaY superfamily)